ncbi:type II toxin-antitoxin system HicB family antitoxin [Fundidesulfovibrio putealis]|uniref:type II toxin-antitoxin system HicB family antitoxin n=1 Tax=Fundidesulfovibrio putealis TaxID=270496 RepID=UPI00228769EE|nr:type II toxin-antitoxin system HicB family antitoxin [Fundidesulfovibrio putealis]
MILHTEDGVSCGVTVPDFPGCFTSGETLEEALSNVQGAVEAYLLIPGGRASPPSDRAALCEHVNRAGSCKF